MTLPTLQYLPTSTERAAGILKQRCSITVPLQTNEGPFGEATDVTVHEDVPCLVTQLAGREAENASRTNASITVKVRLARDVDVPLSATVHVGEKSYPVLSDQTKELGVYTVLWCGGDRG